MNISTRVYKFKRAVWEYRGKWDPINKKWIIAPSKKALQRVIKGLDRLGIEKAAVKQIDQFSSGLEFENWLKPIVENLKNPKSTESPKNPILP